MTLLQLLGEVTVLWPRMLWLLAPVPILVIAYLWLAARRRRSHAPLAQVSNLSGSADAFGAVRRHLPPLLFLLGLCALIAAVSRPQAVLVLPSLHRTVILAIDASGSMRATDVEPNRLEAAQSAARTFIENQPRHTRIGIVSIAGSASVVQSPTDNREDLMQAIDRLQLQPGTALGSGIYISLATLLPDAGIDIENLVYRQSSRSWRYWPDPDRPAKEHKPVPPGSNRSVAMVLLSDGENTHGPDPLKAAALAANYGVRVYTVGIGSTEGVTLGFSGWSMRVRLDEDTLKKIAAMTHGLYYAAASRPELKKVYEYLSVRMVTERKRATEVTAFVVGVGALLLVISALCSLLWFNRVL